MAWNEFLALIPVIFEFVKGLNLPPKTTAIATTLMIGGIAYSYRYFRPNPLQQEDSETALNDTPDIPQAPLPDENDRTELNSTKFPTAYEVQQNISNADQAIGKIENTGKHQTIGIGNTYYK